MNLIIADAELELVPKELAGHPQVAARARARGKPAEKTLLDSSFHYKALWKETRRGRPDIVHLCLLLAQDSLANHRGGLSVYVHTRDNKVIELSPKTRLPRNYDRFVGLMEQLLFEGQVPPEGEPLLKVKKMTLEGLVKKLGKRVVVFDEKGKEKPLEKLKLKNKTVIIGGFPSGDFLSEVKGQRVSLGEEQLCAWSVVAYALASLEL